MDTTVGSAANRRLLEQAIAGPHGKKADATGGAGGTAAASSSQVLKKRGEGEGSGASQSQGSGGPPAGDTKFAYLTSKFAVGCAKNDRLDFPFAQKVFHSGDVRPEVLEAKREVQRKKQPNILGIEKDDWNPSTIADPRVQKEVNKDLKRQLLKVRAGLMDERVVKPSKMHTDEAILERQKYIVAATGKGPIGMLSGKWVNATDERGLPAHPSEPKWADWNPSTSTFTKEDKKQVEARMVKQEQQRRRMMTKDPKMDMETYIDPKTSIENVNERLRERKLDFRDLKEQFKRELKVEFPTASEERLQAMAQRLLNEKLLADAKLARFPVQHESFKPNLSLTTQDRRFKVYSHPGTYTFCELDDVKRFCWSCCMNFDKDSKGCEFKVVNPDAWCVLGFERYGGSKH